MTTDNKKHLFYLNELSDYKVASDDPDVREWPVHDKDGQTVGKVDNLLVNKSTQKVVYLDVEVNQSIIDKNYEPYGKPADSGVHEFINEDGENHIIIPIGMVAVDSKDKTVKCDTIDHNTFARTKRYRKGSTIKREYEIVVMDHYTNSKIDKVPGDGFYEGNAFKR